MSALRFAIKSLARTPGFTLIAIITLGLGIGANTSMFSILNGYMLRPAPYADADRLDRIYRASRQDSRGGFSPADYLDLKPETSGYGEIAAYAFSDMSIALPGKPAEMADGLRISANLFSTLGTRPALGRSFRPDEETFGNHHVLIISDRYWQNRFGADPRIIGRTVRVDGEPHEIVGVLPANFSDWRHLSWVDVFRPLGFDEKETRDRSSARLRLVGRRSANVSRGQADAFIASFGRRLARDFPAANAESTWRTIPIDDSFLPGDGRGIISM
ncbi:MAG: permease, partial [Acidobacteria bacterium]